MPADRRHTMRCFFAVVFILAAWAFMCPANAQITQTARIELNNEQVSLPLGPDIYITRDEEQRLSDQIIANRHENNLRGTRQDSNVLNLGFSHVPVWMVFSVTNSSRQEDWLLHFGTMAEGRLGLARKLMVKNQTRDEIFIRVTGEKDDIGSADDLADMAVPVKIGVGKTELFVVYLEPTGNMPATFAPRLSAASGEKEALAWPLIFKNILLVFFIAAAGFFGAIAYIEKAPFYALFSVYYISNMAMFLLMQSMFFVSFSLAGDLGALLFPVCFLAGLAMTWVFLGITAEDYSDNAVALSLGSFVAASALAGIVLPGIPGGVAAALIFLPAVLSMAALAGVVFIHGQRGNAADYFLATGWMMPFIGMIMTVLAAAHIFSSNALLLNAYWFALAPQAFFFAAGITKKVEISREQIRAALGRESRAAQSLARLKQSKETADQARLLRVIERERELMAELREQEMQRTEEMRRAKETADQANRAKSAFLAVVSHEIRTPMTGIMGILRLLKDTKMSKEQGDFFLTIQKSADTMMALLNDILDFEKIESGNMEMEEIDFDLPKLVQGVVTLMAGHAAQRNVVLQADIPRDFPAILRGDPTRLRQVLLNLVNNAIKFTENGSVTIRLRATKLENKQFGVKGDYEVYFGVEDTGIGISEKAQERLFTPFEQADSTVSRKYGGTGLGLAICQRLVTAMGSAISLSSQIGVGSTFFFSLLMKRGQASQVDEDAGAPGMAGAEGAPSGAPMRVLVIEDNEINRKVLENVLSKEGHNVSLADSAEMGLEIFNRDNFDAVFMDINLNGMNGLEAARTIRSFPDRGAAATPLIALTGNVGEEDIKSFYAAGFNAFIGKPIDYDRLIALLADIRANKMKSDRVGGEPPAAPKRPGPARKGLDENPRGEKQEDGKRKPEQSRRGGEALKDDIAPIHKFLREQEMGETKSELTEIIDFGKIFDMKMLNGLVRSLGKGPVKELLDGFIEKTDEIVTGVARAEKAGDMTALYERAHELKGMAANFGMRELTELATLIEKAAEKETIRAEEIARLPEAAQKTKAAIRSWLK